MFLPFPHHRGYTRGAMSVLELSVASSTGSTGLAVTTPIRSFKDLQDFARNATNKTIFMLTNNLGSLINFEGGICKCSCSRFLKTFSIIQMYSPLMHFHPTLKYLWRPGQGSPLRYSSVASMRQDLLPLQLTKNINFPNKHLELHPYWAATAAFFPPMHGVPSFSSGAVLS